MSRKKTEKKSDETTRDEDTSSIFSFDSEDFDTRQMAGAMSNHVVNLEQFLNNPEVIRPAGSHDWTILDRCKKGKVYCITGERVKHFLLLLEKCRTTGYAGSFAENQAGESGIMLDFDIYQDTEADQISNCIKILCTNIAVLLKQILVIPDNDVFYMAITRKPRIKFDSRENNYKDGFHLLMPGIHVTKIVRKFIVTKIIESKIVEDSFRGVVPSANKPADSRGAYSVGHFLDLNSAHVPCYFYGCITKPNAQSYKLTTLIRWQYVCGNLVSTDEDIKAFEARENLTLELSLNYVGKYIPKKKYTVADEFINQVTVSKTGGDEIEFSRIYGEMSLSAINDGKISELKSLLDILSPDRASRYDLWRDVIFALASERVSSYRALAHYFSMKSKNYDAAAVDKLWDTAVANYDTSKARLHVSSIAHWARADNPQAMNEHVGSTIRDIVYDGCYDIAQQGRFYDAHIAVIIQKYLPHKYVVDIPEGELKPCWFEYVTEDEASEPGEANKWLRHKGKPYSLDRFISDNVPRLFKEAMVSIKRKMESEVEDGRKKGFSLLIKNLRDTTNSLAKQVFKNNIIAECVTRFTRRGWAKKLDADPRIRGVRNGVLKLADSVGNKPVLYPGFHNFAISRYTDVEYIPFDPYDPLTKEILIALRCYFLDEEQDSFDFTMYYLASTLDGEPKDSVFAIMIGKGSNGKSTLLSLHAKVIGGYSVKLPISLLTSVRPVANQATPEIAALKDASLAYFSESNQFERINTAVMKELTGQEVIYARKLFQDMINFTPKCHYLVMSNHDFEIPTSDYGTWRRILYIPLKIRFENAHQNLSVSDGTTQKFIRRANPNIQKTWPLRPDVLGRYLGIMVYYHWKFNKHYNGQLLSVPHRHIEYETMKYQNSQNMVDKFITSKFVKVADSNAEFNLKTEAKKFVQWIKNDCKRDVPLLGAIEFLKNSVVLAHIRETNRGDMLVGHRFLADEETKLSLGEEYVVKEVCTYDLPPDNFGVPITTPEQYYENICKEYDGCKSYFAAPTYGSENFDQCISQEFTNEEKSGDVYLGPDISKFTLRRLEDPKNLYKTEDEKETHARRERKWNTYEPDVDGDIEFTTEDCEDIIAKNVKIATQAVRTRADNVDAADDTIEDGWDEFV